MTQGFTATRIPDAEVTSAGIEQVWNKATNRQYTAVARGIVEGERSVLLIMGVSARWCPESLIRKVKEGAK